jgi:GT2 family glycosyltransferase
MNLESTKHIDVSVIIVNYNTKKLLSNCLESIFLQTNEIEYEVIVVDNASVDGSNEMLRQNFPNVRLIESETNLGFGKANNLGIRNALGKYIFLLNSDTIIIGSSIKIFFDFMENHIDNRVACCGGDLIDSSNNKQVSYGNFPSLLQVFSELGLRIFYRSFYRKYLSVGVKSYDDKKRNVDYISGADMFIRKSVLDEVGLFDEDFFLYYEESELSYRFYKYGFKSVFIPEVKIIHLEGGSISGNIEYLDWKNTLILQSRDIFFQKCYGRIIAIIVKYLYNFVG